MQLDNGGYKNIFNIHIFVLLKDTYICKKIRLNKTGMGMEKTHKLINSHRKSLNNIDRIRRIKTSNNFIKNNKI